VKKRLTIAVVGAALAVTLTFVAAGSSDREPVTEADVLPVDKVLTTVRSMGLNPAGEPARQGPNYVLHAYDRHGTEVRVVADAHFGDILSIAPARALNTTYVPNYQRGPRIIHVPQAGARASVNDRDEPAISNDNDDEEIAPAPRRRIMPQRQKNTPPHPRTPRWQPRSAAPPPPPAIRRTVLSAPPPPAEGPTPIRPTPSFNSKADPADKFGQPRDAGSSAPPPPVGYTPPTALPHDD